MPLKLFTIGFTKKSAETFFAMLQRGGVKRVVDIRLNNTSQLAGFTRRDDLAYFLRSIAGIEYVHRLDLAPTQELLDRARKSGDDWSAYERDFRALMVSRKIDTTVPQSLLDGACLLCSEHHPLHCHRRLVAEFLRERWQDVESHHLV
jgi:uncharacterized protein (DUF488 family)